MLEREINVSKSNEQDGGELDPPFKIIFMDCNMPVMDGFETTRKILEICQRNNAEKPYIVALTAHDVRNDKNIKA
jgi:CheY-like chemotaxis protein